jgi:hypothetical protein
MKSEPQSIIRDCLNKSVDMILGEAHPCFAFRPPRCFRYSEHFGTAVLPLQPFIRIRRTVLIAV